MGRGLFFLFALEIEGRGSSMALAWAAAGGWYACMVVWWCHGAAAAMGNGILLFFLQIGRREEVCKLAIGRMNANVGMNKWSIG